MRKYIKVGKLEEKKSLFSDIEKVYPKCYKEFTETLLKIVKEFNLVVTYKIKLHASFFSIHHQYPWRKYNKSYFRQNERPHIMK